MDTRPPPNAPPPSYALLNRVYRKSYRPIAIICACFACLYALVWGAGALRDISTDKQVLPQLTTFDVVLGILYMVVAVIEFFGIFASASQKLKLVRTYAFLSVLSVVLVMAAELMRVVLHFKFKDALINECKQGSQGTTYRTGSFWGGSSQGVLSESQALQWCTNSWNRGSFSDIAWFLAATIFGWLFASIVFSYYHQLLQSPSRIAPSDQIRMGVLPPGPYNAPPYPPPEHAPPYESQKPPGYEYGARDMPDDKKQTGYHIDEPHPNDPFVEEDLASHGPKVQGGENRFV